MTSQHHVLTYADSAARTPRDRWPYVIAGTALVLTVPSLVVVVLGATQEPYHGPVRLSQALTQVGGGCVLIVAWAQWMVSLAVAVQKRVVRRAWLLALIWAAVNLFYLSNSPLGYLADVGPFQSGRHRMPATNTPALTGDDFDSQCGLLYRRYLAGDLAEAKQRLLETIKLIDRASFEPDVDAGHRWRTYARLYVLCHKARQDSEANAYLVHLQHAILRGYELRGETEETAGRRLSEFTPEKSMQAVDTWDAQNSNGEGPAYLKQLTGRGAGRTPATTNSSLGS